MTSSRFRNSVAAVLLTGALAATPIAAMAQDGPPPQYTVQYADPQGSQAGMQQDAGAQYGAPQEQYGAPQGQYGAPQGVEQAPPPIPDYEQPPAPGDGYIWTPGYWAWTGDGYEWVHGAWVAAPYVGALWTPGYWGYGGYGYFWNAGYWGPYVGYYGGINYGFGYFGIGFYGGYWGGGRFWYNRAYCNYRGGFGYSRSYNGYSGHAGGASFVHSTAIAANRGAGSAAFRGSTVNGRSANFAQSASRSGYTGSAYNGARSFNGSSNYSGNARSYGGGSNYSGYSGAARSYSAPSGGYHGGGAVSGGGGGFHGGGGGGGGSHGGGHR
ncbi:MAG: colicin transporter [Edaphobacter sp.]